MYPFSYHGEALLFESAFFDCKKKDDTKNTIQVSNFFALRGKAHRTEENRLKREASRFGNESELEKEQETLFTHVVTLRRPSFQPSPTTLQQHSNNEAEDGARVHHPHQTHATQLATEFQAQGDKLAMVRIIVPRTHVVLMGSVVICFVGKGKVE
ncbi:hypothetical protein Fmac_007646 [Flemingia macrophylla]|uniref:Uncharacterized protein n=1 Tax=Flemingia macrophylla TaxID=520843 RepID=A0ABD1MVN0_9FABA